MAEKVEDSKDIQTHPSVVAGIRTAMARHYTKDEIVRITGAAYEVVDREFQRAKEQRKG